MSVRGVPVKKTSFERLLFALEPERDPWQERIAGVAKHEYEEIVL